MKLNTTFIRRQLSYWKVTQKELARVLHTNPRTVERWLNNSPLPSTEYIVRLSIVLDCRVEDLVILEESDRLTLL